jgi:hypothetical protein
MNQDIIIKSKGFRVPHSHTITVPASAISHPPSQGVTLTTSKGLFHTHKVIVTQQQLSAVNQGQEVTVKDDSGVHSFTISKK